MIETRDLTKIYKGKGTAVVALNKINLKLPDKGMVFILGKSGSGKSTLLNVLGGLDSFDSGEIIFKGKSTITFKQADYDSYRNTYIGFIFQEYNILQDFTVAANIGLAIELQGRKVTDEEVNSILHEMELDNLGGRKPNELSGGQLQRVAIARALVKKPQIIMADEPTGALDSATSTQIFDVLKKLSKEKLVLIISHDREFSELYADRIIELKDGNIISDVSVNNEKTKEVVEENVTYGDNAIFVREQYHLTEEDLKNINDYLDKMKGETVITSKKTSKRSNKVFEDTDQNNVEMSQEGYKLIKSTLSPKNAFKIGTSSLKHKPFKLIVAIFLASVAFILFGLSDTIAAYNERSTAISSMINSNIHFATYITQTVTRYDGDNDYYYSEDRSFLTADNMEILHQMYGQEVVGVLNETSSINYANTNYDYNRGFSINPSINGLMKLTDSMLSSYGFTLKDGRLPSASDEMCISYFVYKAIEKNGISYTHYDEYTSTNITLNPTNYSQLYNDEILIANHKIVGIVDTKLDFDGYFDSIQIETAMDLIRYSFISSNLDYGPHCLGFITEEEYNQKYANYSSLKFAIAPMALNRDAVAKAYDIQKEVKTLTNRNSQTNQVRFALKNEVTDQLKSVTSGLEVLGKIFMYVSIFFAFFAIITLSNYIATSISYKKHDIGILRAIGSRGHDVFKIFFAESFVIAMINYVIATIGTIGISIAINSGLAEDAGFKVSILNFGIRQVALIFAVVMLVAWIATALPVRKISRKKPIDAIKGR